MNTVMVRVKLFPTLERRGRKSVYVPQTKFKQETCEQLYECWRYYVKSTIYLPLSTVPMK